MMNFISLVKSKGFAQMSSTVCATGGGAEKYAKEAETVLLLIKITINWSTILAIGNASAQSG